MTLAHLTDRVSPVLLFLILAVGGYGYAFYDLHRRGRLASLRRRGLVRPWQPVWYAAGVAVLGAALVSPLHDLAEERFSMHMVQHILVMMIAPLFILFGLPLPLARRLIQKTHLRRPLGALSHPLAAFLIFNGNLLAWHAPAFYQAALASEWLHDLQHALFFYTGLLFYWRLIDPTHGWFPFWEWPPARWLYLLVAAPPSYILGSILWASNAVFYPYYAQLEGPGGPAALADQAVGGMLMWLHGWMFMMASLFVFFRGYEPGMEQAQE